MAGTVIAVIYRTNGPEQVTEGAGSKSYEAKAQGKIKSDLFVVLNLVN